MMFNFPYENDGGSLNWMIPLWWIHLFHFQPRELFPGGRLSWLQARSDVDDDDFFGGWREMLIPGNFEYFPKRKFKFSIRRTHVSGSLNMTIFNK